MSLHITYFVHGTTLDNEQGLATGWLPGQLSELGKKQSRELGEFLKNKKFDAIYCSDLNRAVETVRLAFPDFPFTADQRLREINYGNFNGQTEEFKSDLGRYITKPFPNGESYRDVENRLRELLTELQNKFSGQRLAFVAHQAPQLALEVICSGKTWPQAIKEDWRLTGAWKPGWEYYVRS